MDYIQHIYMYECVCVYMTRYIWSIAFIFSPRELAAYRSNWSRCWLPTTTTELSVRRLGEIFPLIYRQYIEPLYMIGHNNFLWVWHHHRISPGVISLKWFAELDATAMRANNLGHIKPIPILRKSSMWFPCFTPKSIPPSVLVSFLFFVFFFTLFYFHNAWGNL